MKKILFDAKDERVAKIADAFAKCGRRGTVAAAYSIAAKYVKLYELAEEKRTDKVRVAYGAGRLWARGVIKMPVAKVAILAAHAAARAAYSPVACAAARAVAQAVSTVHTPKHAMGVVYYGLTAIALAKGGDKNCDEITAEVERMLAVIDGYAQNEPSPDGWATFLLTKEEKAERRKQLKEAAGRGVLEFSQTGDVGASKGKRSRKGGEASQPDDGEGGSSDEKGDVQKQNVPEDDKTSPSSQPTSKNVKASVAATASDSAQKEGPKEENGEKKSDDAGATSTSAKSDEAAGADGKKDEGAADAPKEDGA